MQHSRSADHETTSCNWRHSARPKPEHALYRQSPLPFASATRVAAKRLNSTGNRIGAAGEEADVLSPRIPDLSWEEGWYLLGAVRTSH